MRCDAFEDRLQQLLDERQCPEADDLLSEHAADCPHCRDVLDAQAGLFDTVRDWSVANLEVDLVSRVVSRATAPAVERRWWQLASARWISLAVAGAILVMAWKGFDGSRTAESGSPNSAERQDGKSGKPSYTYRAPQQLLPGRPLDLDAITQQAAKDLGLRLALGVHYIHRGRSAVTDALRGQFSRKSEATPGERSSSRLLTFGRSYAMS
jgi:hypothetical protein